MPTRLVMGPLGGATGDWPETVYRASVPSARGSVSVGGIDVLLEGITSIVRVDSKRD